jgi:hypothetical protein
LRGAHISFINDAKKRIDAKNDKERQKLWNQVKKIFHRKEVKLILELDPKTDGKHWWLRVHPDSRGELQAIRDILGIGEPEHGFHMTIGYANERNLVQSDYLRTLSLNKFI